MTTVQHAPPAATSKPSEFQRAHWFADAADAAAMGSSNEVCKSLPDSVWASRAVAALQTFAMPMAFWFKPVCVCFALVWLVYRAYQVLNKPLDELASLLGFDIPLTPVTDLASIKADGAIVHWSLPERPKNKTKLKFEVHINGSVVDGVPIQESAVTITGLQPSSFYVVRVALVNEAEFGSRSKPIRFRTKPASSGDFFVLGVEGHETEHDGSNETLPHVRLYRGLKDITPAAIEAAPMSRETSSGGLAPKRSINGRRPSPAVLGLDTKHGTPTEEVEPPEGAETIQQLTEKLGHIRRETDDAERQAREEEEEELRMKDELTHERDELKAEATEKERASRNLKREVNTLERQNTAAQNERSKHERLLQHKKQERQKSKGDLVRWQREAEEMQADVERIRKDKETHLHQIEQEKEVLRTRQADEASAMRNLDDEIREKNAEIKKLERAIRNTSPDTNEPDTSIVHQFQQEAEEERSWNTHRLHLQQQYAMTAQKLEAAKRFHSEQARYLESVRAQRRRDEEMAQQQQYGSPPPAAAAAQQQENRPLRRGDSQRSRRAPSGHSASDSPRLGGFAISAGQGGPFGGGGAMTSVSPAGFTSAPFLNIHNGMTIVGPGGGEGGSMSEEDREKLTGGAPMSPGAGAELLPADLFSGESEGKPAPAPPPPAPSPKHVLQHIQPLPGLGSLPGLPGLPPPPTYAAAHEHPGPGPASPASASSRSPSVFASPQASQNNLHLGSPENVIDADRRSIRSTRSNRATSGTAAGSRFSSMFGIKPRTKTLSPDDDDGSSGLPALGKAQSHSMPRQDQGIPGLDSATRKRNSSISGSMGFGAESSPPSSDVGLAVDPPPAAAAANGGAGRRRMLGMGSIFGKDKEGGWPASFTSFASSSRRPGSPRPGSTHSSNELPRPSVDSSSQQQRWGVDTWPSSSNNNDGTTTTTTVGGAARSSPLAFGPGWPAPHSSQGQQQQQQQQSRLFGSRHPSRRPSVQYGAGMGPPEDIMEDEDSDALGSELVGGEGRRLAPIGTKPAAAAGKKTAVVEQVPAGLEGDGEPASAAGAAAVGVGPAGVPKLNPAAKDFKSFFGIKSKERGSGSGSGNGGGGGSATPLASFSAATTTPNAPPPANSRGEQAGFDDESPPNSRKSRDTRSMTTTESSVLGAGEESFSSGRNSRDLARTPSYSDAQVTMGSSMGSLGKESFMQKISRKSSSGKFGLPGFAKRGEKGGQQQRMMDGGVGGGGYGAPASSSGNSPAIGPPSYAEDGEEEAMSASVGSLREGRESREAQRGAGGGRSWSSVLKLGKGKRGGGETPSLSGLSLASGTTGGGTEEEGEGESE